MFGLLRRRGLAKAWIALSSMSACRSGSLPLNPVVPSPLRQNRTNAAARASSSSSSSSSPSRFSAPSGSITSHNRRPTALSWVGSIDCAASTRQAWTAAHCSGVISLRGSRRSAATATRTCSGDISPRASASAISGNRRSRSLASRTSAEASARRTWVRCARNAATDVAPVRSWTRWVSPATSSRSFNANAAAMTCTSPSSSNRISTGRNVPTPASRAVSNASRHATTATTTGCPPPPGPPGPPGPEPAAPRSPSSPTTLRPSAAPPPGPVAAPPRPVADAAPAPAPLRRSATRRPAEPQASGAGASGATGAGPSGRSTPGTAHPAALDAADAARPAVVSAERSWVVVMPQR